MDINSIAGPGAHWVKYRVGYRRMDIKSIGKFYLATRYLEAWIQETTTPAWLTL